MFSSKQSEYVRSVLVLDNTNINTNANINTNIGTWRECRGNLRPSIRKLVQLYSALLYNAHLRGFIEGEIYQGSAKAVCVPGFNCYSCPGAIAACPLGAIQNALAWSGHRAGWYVLGIIMLFGLSLGRTICGWLCPLGLIQELLHKVPTHKIKKSCVTRALSYLKYIILVLFVIAIPMWYGIRHDLAVPGFCKYICPAGTFEGAIGLLSNPGNESYFSMLKILFTRKFVIMLIIGLTCIFCYRSFCRFICPLGAIYGLFNRLALVSVKVDENRCNSCGACVRHCRMDVRYVGDHECINCAGCMSSCSRNALSLRAGTHAILAPAYGCDDDQPDSAQKRSKKERQALHASFVPLTRHKWDVNAGGIKSKYGRIVWGTALAFLCFALLWFNFLDPSVRAAGALAADTQAMEEQTADAKTTAEQQMANAKMSSEQQTADAKMSGEQQTAEPRAESGNPYASKAPVGIAIGEQMADFTTELIDGSSFHLADQRGKLVIINMWATYCGPCVQELPIFQDFLRTHGGDVSVLIIHASDPLEDVAEFLQKKDVTLPCAIDSMDNYLYSLCGASPSILPHTVILNRQGEIVYNQTGSMTRELLDELFKK